MVTETTPSGQSNTVITIISDAERWHWLTHNPYKAHNHYFGVRHMLDLLQRGKGTPEDFENLVDKIIISEKRLAEAFKSS